MFEACPVDLGEDTGSTSLAISVDPLAEGEDRLLGGALRRRVCFSC